MKKKYGQHQEFVEALPFLGLLFGLATFICLLIWLIETFGEK
jgi:hypothetical protein